jgi:ribosomal protein S18 acetylase RimI-like enzyme
MVEAFRRQRGRVSEPNIIRLSETDIDRLREIRLEALRANPEAFSADLAIEEALTPEQWRQRLVNTAWFASIEAQTWRGIGAFSRRSPSRKESHTGWIGSIYVRPAHRRKGIANQLLEALLDHAANEVDQVVLTVNADNKTAIALYERHGFRVYGRMPRSLHIDDRYYDELEMVRPVSASD